MFYSSKSGSTETDSYLLNRYAWFRETALRRYGKQLVIDRLRDIRRYGKQLAMDRLLDLSREGKQLARDRLLDLICDTKNLANAFDYCRSHGGQSAGKDEVYYQEINEPLKWHLLETVARSIFEGMYVPGQDRPVDIPKGDGTCRQICVQSIVDRVTQRATLNVLQPIVSPSLCGLTFSRKPFHTLHALALAKHLAEQENRWVFVINDITQAYDRVPFGPMFSSLKEYVPCDKTLSFLHSVLKIGSDKFGIRQGGPLSMLALDVYLTQKVESLFGEGNPRVPLLRYVDDLLIPCQNRDEAERASEQVSMLVQKAELALKYNSEKSICELNSGEPAPWLGYLLAKQKQSNRLHFELDLHPESKLVHNLKDEIANTKKDFGTSLALFYCLRDIVVRAAPAYESVKRKKFLNTLLDIAEDGQSELPTVAILEAEWKRATGYWNILCKNAGRWFETRRDKGSYLVNCEPHAALYVSKQEVAYRLTTDGAFRESKSPRAKFGAWAYIIQNLNAKRLRAKADSLSDSSLTNNRMELMAVIQGLRKIKSGQVVQVVTDSSYVRGKLRRILEYVELNRTTEGVFFEVRFRTNLDLWEKLVKLLRTRKILVQQRPRNSTKNLAKCDAMCTKAMDNHLVDDLESNLDTHS